MTSGHRLIVFDCDGTLLDSQHLIVEAMQLTFQGAGLSTPDRGAVLTTVGLSIPEALTALAPSETIDTRERIARTYRDWCTALRRQNKTEPLFPGAEGLLAELASRDDVILGLATGKSRRGVARFIDENGLHGMFATIQTADDAPSKPHPAMLFQAMAEAGVQADAVIMVGDTSYDMMMAGYAKVAALGVSWGYHPAPELVRAGARRVVRSFAALRSELDQIFAARYEAVA